jgi:hypothetical protein
MTDQFDTYFVVGMKAGNPVVYLESEIPGMDRERVCSIRELRHIIDVVASDLHLRAIADTILATQNTQSSEEQVKARVEGRYGCEDEGIRRQGVIPCHRRSSAPTKSIWTPPSSVRDTRSGGQYGSVCSR